MVDVGYSGTFFRTYEKKIELSLPASQIPYIFFWFFFSWVSEWNSVYIIWNRTLFHTLPYLPKAFSPIFLRLSNIICLHWRTKYFENNLQTVFAWALPIKTGFSLQRDYSKWIILSKLKTPYTYSTFSKSIKKDARRSLWATSCFSISCTNILLYILSYRDSKR